MKHALFAVAAMLMFAHPAGSAESCSGEPSTCSSEPLDDLNYDLAEHERQWQLQQVESSFPIRPLVGATGVSVEIGGTIVGPLRIRDGSGRVVLDVPYGNEIKIREITICERLAVDGYKGKCW